MTEKLIQDWFFSPGEKIRSIGFYQNPYKQFSFVKFDHIWALDEKDNLYVGQFSVYPEHLDDMFKIKHKQEFGKVLVMDTPRNIPVILISNLEVSNIIYINRRLRKIAQRFYDYGAPPNSVVVSINHDLGNPSIFNILKGQPWERPSSKPINA